MAVSGGERPAHAQVVEVQLVQPPFPGRQRVGQVRRRQGRMSGEPGTDHPEGQRQVPAQGGDPFQRVGVPAPRPVPASEPSSATESDGERTEPQGGEPVETGERGRARRQDRAARERLQERPQLRRAGDVVQDEQDAPTCHGTP
ncbi:hypothetical protein O1L60_32895 [Streptomyces diastatochromogenes]|nr:hypothetical protein [Streptomyces diastatochromogenes]